MRYLIINDVLQLWGYCIKTSTRKRQDRLTLPFLHTPTTWPFSESTFSYASRGFSNMSLSFKRLCQYFGLRNEEGLTEMCTMGGARF